MRLKLTLLPLNPRTSVPINYNYPLAAAIYKLLAQASPEYADWLHEKGYRSPADRLLKLFTFSRLNIPQARPQGNTLAAGDERPWLLQIASPMEDEFVQNFVLGLFQQQNLEIGGPGAVGRFLIEQVEALAPPVFKETMQFKALSPIVVSTMREHHGKLQPYYYRAHETELGEAIRQNLLQKYQTIQGEAPADTLLVFEIDRGYLERQGGPEKVSKLIAIKEGTAEETRIKGFMCPFTLAGSPELMRVAWECGVGDHNSMGCGMVEVIIGERKSG
ncbi:MAG: CRISPR-associated endoribonuclease Cas6 [bacterium]